MALVPLVDLDTFKLRMEPETVDDERGALFLQSASTAVRTETGRVWVDSEGDLEVFAENGEMVWDILRTVTLEVAARLWYNPRGSTQQAVGPFSDSLGAQAADILAATPGLKAMLAQAVAWTGSAPSAGLWTQGTTRGPLQFGILYAPVAQGGDPIPMLSLDYPY